MPQLDKLLAHIAPRGGTGLCMEPDRQPMLQMASGADQALLPNPIPSTMIELLAREVLPHHLEEVWNTRGEASFDHSAGGEAFHLTLTRSPQGIRIQAGALPRPGAALAPR
ncbi:MAG: hypothetical protein P4L36_12510, partial [Holophaga sp.]|nr:hypothetical protein [Holophaga sp.]